MINRNINLKNSENEKFLLQRIIRYIFSGLFFCFFFFLKTFFIAIKNLLKKKNLY